MRKLIFAVWFLAATLAFADGKNSEPSTAAAGPTGSSYLFDDKHKLVPGDKVSVRIMEDRDEAKKLTVGDGGEIDAPYIGRLIVANKTCKDVAGELKTLLEKEYYYQATVIIGIDTLNRAKNQIWISGHVLKQGPVEIPEGESLTVSKALLLAGGFSEFANKSRVTVIRKTESGEKKTFEVNISDVMKGNLSKDLVLKPDDYIIVPPRLVNF